MRRLSQLILLGVLLTSLIAIGSARAALVVYSDKASFLGTTSATSATGPLPSLPSSVNELTVGTVTFQGSMWFGAEFVSEVDWTTRLPGADLAINNNENLDVLLANAVTALGFDFVEPQFDPNINESFAESTFTVSAYMNAALVGSFQFNAPNDTAYFVGFLADAAFNKVLIRETVGSSENEFFGQFYTNDPANPRPVPEPATLFLFAFGVAGMIAARGRARKPLR